MNLTEHQSNTLSAALQILSKSNRILIKGSAGVGKTTMVNSLVKKLPNNRKIYCSAPTNKAVAVLKTKVDEIHNLEFITIHSALKIKARITKNGNKVFAPSYHEKYPPLKGVGILIVDETSMIESDILSFIEEHANKNNTKVIFIGDDKQLNPVNEEESPVFHKNYPELELTEIIRQGEGNPIITLSRDLDLIKSYRESLSDTNSGYIYSNSENRIIEKLSSVNGTDELKYLAWTNKEVDRINKLVRENIYGSPRKIELGETIIFNSPYNDSYYTNEEVKVKTLVVEENNIDVVVESNNISKSFSKETKKLKLYIINGAKIDGKWSSDSIKIIHEDSESDFRILKSKLFASAKSRILEWLDYFTFVEGFADFKYNHALSVHKSQGSTYKNTIVNYKNINLNKSKKEKQRLLYTAVTRASELLIIYNV